jgi:Cu2+-exporting ATPase
MKKDNSMKNESHKKDKHNHTNHHAMMVKDFRKRFWVSLIITIPILILSPMIQKLIGFQGIVSFNGSIYILFVLSSFLFLYGGFPFLKGFVNEIKKGKPGMMTLIAVAISVAYLYSAAVVFGLDGKIFFWEIVTLIDIMLLGHWIEMKSVMGASKALKEIAKLLPSDAHKIDARGKIVDVPLEKLSSGEKVLIKPGEKIPADGKIIDGYSSVNEAMLTGESKPVSKKQGDSVIGGSINGEGSLTVRVEKAGKDSYISQMIKLVKNAQASKSKTQNLTDRVALWLTIIAISVSGITLAIWMIMVNKDFAFSLERSITVMVITCPHALGLAIPLVIAVSTALSAKSGILIRNRKAFETAKDKRYSSNNF